MKQRLQIIEPTLDGYAGHCYSLVASLCGALDGAIDVWAAKGADGLGFRPDVRVHPYYRRRIRLFQQLCLYRRLLRQGSPIVVTTARRSDLLLLNFLARSALPATRVFVCFHWFRETPRRLQLLEKIARRLPNLVIFGTTASVVDSFRRAGFADVHLLPYPSPVSFENSAKSRFRRLLYAGAARRDKGFRQVVDLVALLAQRQEKIPVTVQISAEHFGKYDAGTVSDIARLRGIDYAHLQLIENTLSPGEYAALFAGSVCLQPYDRTDFRDRVSGVTLDALAHGCPIITTAETWMAALIVPYHAGIALQTTSAQTLYDAANTVIADYPRFSKAALEAGHVRDKRSWAALLECLRQSP